VVWGKNDTTPTNTKQLAQSKSMKPS
jgi:hypothetical protein